MRKQLCNAVLDFIDVLTGIQDNVRCGTFIIPPVPDTVLVRCMTMLLSEFPVKKFRIGESYLIADIRYRNIRMAEQEVLGVIHSDFMQEIPEGF